jgi:Arc/MetJ-type ribon-helix-helix transcriptional regulator
MAKARVTVSIDEELAARVQELVESGEGESLSSWVGEAIRQRQDRENRLRALQDVVADYEAEFGEITEEDMIAQQRADAASLPAQPAADAALLRQQATRDGAPSR